MLANFLVRFYRVWHGRLGLKGAGWALRRAARVVPGLPAYPLVMQDGTRVTLDFRDMSAWYWLNLDLGDPHFEEEGLFRAMRARITLDSVVWDVGANAGVLSYVLARWGRRRGNCIFLSPTRRSSPWPARVWATSPSPTFIRRRFPTGMASCE
jgi:hypothetical protein